MTKQTNNLTDKLAIMLIAVLSLFMEPISVKAGSLRDSGEEIGVSHRSSLSVPNLFSGIIFSGRNSINDDTTGIVCPDNISTYTDLNSCDALITSGLNLKDPDRLLTSLTWNMEGATTAQSPSTGMNQINTFLFNEGTTIVTYRGRTRTNEPVFCSFDVIITDIVAPKLDYPFQNIVVRTRPDECMAIVNWPEPTFTDNCTPANRLLITKTHNSGEYFSVGTTDVEYTVSDGNNKKAYSFSITVLDEEFPELNAPDALKVPCGEPIPDAYTFWKQFVDAGGLAFDNCEIDFRSFRYVSQRSTGIRCPYTVVRTYSITDTSGNTSEVEHRILVEGTETIVLKSGAATADEIVYISSGTFTPPAGVTTISVEAWGGGGGGAGSTTNKYGGGGGGGGAYTINSAVNVTSGTLYAITVGSGGNGGIGNSNGSPGASSTATFGGTTVTASGGNGGLAPNTSTGGNGGTGTYNGGAGSIGERNVNNGRGGGGGSSAGTGSNGSDGIIPTGGVAPAGGGNGGNGGISGLPGNVGAGPGGGGGGAGQQGGNGGAGATGQMKLIWTCPNYNVTGMTVPTPYCVGSSQSVTLTASAAELPVGTYNVDYSITGANAASGTLNMSVSTAGLGSINLPVLSNPGSTTISITYLSSGSGLEVCGNSVSLIQNVTIYGTPTFTTQPTAPAPTCSGNGTQTMTVTVFGGYNMVYSWRKNGVALTDGAVVSGQGTSILTLTNPIAADVGNYDVIVSSGCASDITSNSVSVSILAATLITAENLSGQTTCQNINFTPISVTASGSGPLNYQWFSNSSASNSGGTLISGATSASYTPPATDVGTNYYYAEVTGDCGTATSSVSGSFTVNPTTTIDSQYTPSQTVCMNNAFNPISVVASGAGTLTYQWYRNTIATNSGGTLIVGAISDTYTPSSTMVGTLYYYVMATGVCGSITSAISGAHTVSPSTSITSESLEGQTVCIGDAFTAIGVTASGSGTLTYQWFSNTTASTTGGILISGATGSTYTPSATTVGTIYYYAEVTGDCGSVTSSVSGGFIVNDVTQITAQSTAAQITCQGVNFSPISVTASSAGTLTYQWYSNTTASNSGGALISGATSASYTPSAANPGILYYYAVVIGTCGSATSAVSGVFEVRQPATVDAGPAIPAICQGETTDPLEGSYSGSATDITWTSSVGGTFSDPTDPNATWTPPTNYKGTATLTISTVGPCATVNASKQVQVIEQPNIVVQPVDMIDCYERVVEFNVTATGSGLSYTWYRNRPGDGSFIELTGTETNVDVSNPGILHLTNVGDLTHNPDGTQYKVLVSNGNCEVESNEVLLTVNKITAVNGSESPANSTNVTLCFGSPFTYTAITNHPENIVSYQWKKWVTPGLWADLTNTSVISGVNTETISFTNATEAESGEYKVQVQFNATSALGCTAMSDNYNRTITFLPALEPVIITSDQQICSGVVPALLDASVSGGSGTTYTYQWQSSPDNSDWSDISGATSEDYQPPALSVTTYFRLVVTDTGGSSCGTQASDSILITVDPPPTATAGGTQTICPNTTATVSGALATNYDPGTILWSHNGAGSLTDETTFTPTYTPDPSDADKTITLTMTVTGDATCGVSSVTASATYEIIIESNTVADISYPVTDVCNDAGILAATNSGSGGGVFSSTPSGLSINSSTGNINIDASSPGTYEIVYLIASTGTCNQESDTVHLTINDVPVGSISGDTTVCENETEPEVTFTASGGMAEYTFYYRINSGATQSETTSGSNSVSITVPTDIIGSFVYTLDSVVDASSTTCAGIVNESVTVKVNQLPTATISGTTTVCEGETSPVILFSGSGGQLPYTFYYRIDGGAIQNVKTNGGSSATVFVDTNTPGNTIYTLVEVKDGSAIHCINSNVADTVIVTVKPEPTVSITSSADEVCLAGPEPVITITGHGGETPYTFVYSINNGAFQTVSSLATDSIYTIYVPTNVADTLVYEIASVTDGGSVSCLVSPIGIEYQVIISPPLEAIVDVTDSISCVGGSDGQVTITATAGTPPFTYYFDTFSSTDGIFNNMDAGTYFWYVKDVSSCDSISGTFTIEDPDSLHFNTPAIDSVSCVGGTDGSIIISGFGGRGSKTYAISPFVGSQSPSGTFTGLTAQSYTITITDAEGCTKDTIIVLGTTADVTPPVIADCPADITVYTGPGRLTCDQVASWTAPTATDNCTPAASLSWIPPAASPGDLFPVGDTLITYMVEDAAGNKDTCSFTISVVDNTPPVKPSVTSLLTANCLITLDTIKTIDNCAADSIIGVPSTSYNIGFGTTTVWWRFTDDYGNVDSVKQTIVIQDNLDPQWYSDTLFTVSNALELSCTADTSIASTGIPEAYDNCSPVSVTHSDVISFTAPICPSNYTITRTWTARDSSGNTSTGNQYINVSDQTPPEVYCNDTTVATADDIWLRTEIRGITWFDNCGIDTVWFEEESFVFNDESISGFCPDTVFRTYTVYDKCGNSTTCTQTIIVDDLSTCSYCQDGVQNFLVNLNDAPDSSWVATSEVRKREGYCCDDTNFGDEWNCISFNVYLDEDAVGLILDGRAPWPSGESEYYRVNCVDSVGLDGVICLDGGRWYTITFCKPGQDRPEYRITSISGAVVPDSLTTRADVECYGDLEVSGLDPSTIEWTVSYPAGADSLTKYLSCTDCENPTFTPDSLTPSLIKYEVCGVVAGAAECQDESPIYDCAEVIVNVLPPVKINIPEFVSAVCEDSIPPITATVPFEDPNLTYIFSWYQGSDTTGTFLTHNRTYQPTEIGTYTVTVEQPYAGVGCNSDLFTFEVIADTIGPSLLVPPDTLFLDCSSDTYDEEIGLWLLETRAYEIVDTDSASIEWFDDYSDFTPSCGHTQVVHFWAYDVCNNMSIDSAYIVIEDDIPPVITPASGEVVDCNTLDKNSHPDYIAWLDNNGGATATDDCDNIDSLTWTNNAATQIWDGNGARDSITVTFSVTDDCGNVVSTTATFTFIDDQPPLLSCPASVTEDALPGNCSKVPTTLDDPVYSDLCSNPVLSYIMTGATTGSDTGRVTNLTFNVGITYISYYVTDDAGNIDSCSFTVTIVDVTPPNIEITNCNNVTGTMDANDCEAIPPILDNPLYEDDCWPVDSLILSFEITGAWDTTGFGYVSSFMFPVGVSTVTYTVTDPDDNEASCSFIVTMLQDDIPWTAYNCPPDFVSYTLGATECEIALTLPPPTFNDHCRTATYTVTNDFNGDSVINNEIFPVGITEVIWTITDNSGNDTTCVVTVEIDGIQLPTISCPSNVSGTMDITDCFAQLPNIDTADYSAPCWPRDSLELSFHIINGIWDTTGLGSVSDLYFPVGENTVWYIVTDPDGNQDSCFFTVTILQDAPQWIGLNCPSDPAPYTLGANECEATFTLTPPTVIDECLTSTYVITNEFNGDSIIENEIFPVGSTEVIWHITNNSGWDTTCIVHVVVTGVQYPDVTCPPSVSGTMDITDCFAQLPNIDTADYSSPCWPRDSLELSFHIINGIWDTTGLGSVSDLFFPVGVNTVWYIISDPDGLKDSCFFTVTILQDAPQWIGLNCPSDPAPYTLGANECEATMTLTPPTVNDECLTSTYVITNEFNGDSIIENEIFPVGSTEVIWHITNNSGWDTTCIVHVVVTGVQYPDVTCPPSVSGTLDDATDCYAQLPNIDTADYSSPCWPRDSLELSFHIINGIWDTTGLGSVSDLFFPVGVNTVWYIISDPDGLKDSCSFTVTILQDAIPSTVYTCPDSPANQTVDSTSCDIWVDLDSPVINDHCVTATYSIDNDSPYRTDSADASGYYPIGQHTITWTISNGLGKDTTCVQTFEVFDLEPALVCPPDVEVFADENELFATNVRVGLPYYWDNCDSVLTYTVTTPDSVTSLFNGSPDSINLLDYADTYDLGVTTIEYTFRDGNGHVLVCDFTVTVYAAPDIECPPDTTIYLDGTEADCSATFDPGVATLIEGAPPITWTYTINFPVGSGLPSITDTYVKPDPADPTSDKYADPLGDITFPLGVTTIEWRAENDAGYDTCSHWIEVIDTIPPTFTADPYENCVDPLHWVVYDPTNANPTFNHADPDELNKFPVDFRTMYAGDTFLDLTSLEDNCCDSVDMTINWRIDFSDTPSPSTGAALTHPSIGGTGQPSDYRVGGIPTDIQLWGDGVTFTTMVHTITYWVEDCNGNMSDELVNTITITPRPEIIKQ